MEKSWKTPQSCILDPKFSNSGYVTKNGEYAAVPFNNQFIILHKGQQIHISRTIETAIKFIDNSMKKQNSP